MKNYKVNVNGTEYVIAIELMSDEEAAARGVTPCTGANGVRNVKIIPESTTALTGYINGYRPNQGIGSGAGNLEKSNGIFAKITN